jgi:hypothetical protein
LPSLFWKDRCHPELEELVKEFIVEVFGVFARELCELGRRSNWTAAQVREHADAFLGELTIQAEDKYRDQQGIRYRVRNAGYFGFQGEVRAHVVTSNVWRQLLTDVAAIAEKSTNV